MHWSVRPEMCRPLRSGRGVEAAHAAVRQSGLAKCSDLLTLTTLELVDRLDLYLEEVEDVLEAVAAAVAPQPRTALQLLQSKAAGPRPLRTGLPALDAHLGGGLRAGGVTEVVGPAGMGKTQLCLTVCALAALRWPRCAGGYAAAPFAAVWGDAVGGARRACRGRLPVARPFCAWTSVFCVRTVWIFGVIMFV